MAQADSVDSDSQVTLLTLHNAKGLEFPIVFLAGLEEGLFPHSRSLNSEAQMEEERRLCYVGMTRAEKRLILSWARYRRRFGGGEQERSIKSRFLKEIPDHLIVDAGPAEEKERHETRPAPRPNLYTGKTYNSVENVSQFFAARGAKVPVLPSPPIPARPLPVAPPAPKKPARTGTLVEHPKYGRGTIVRREGDGDEAKITVSFQRHGLKKLIEKYAGLKPA
ncbi:MAG: ATP-binding domain-containing protein [Acidobacteriota bacterium]|nr:ATP-binding domain-containing protein [Acidobacteriota bacterium]